MEILKNEQSIMEKMDPKYIVNEISSKYDKMVFYQNQFQNEIKENITLLKKPFIPENLEKLVPILFA